MILAIIYSLNYHQALKKAYLLRDTLCGSIKHHQIDMRKGRFDIKHEKKELMKLVTSPKKARYLGGCEYWRQESRIFHSRETSA